MSLLEKVSHLKVDSSPPVTEGLTLEMVLENRAPSPFSLSEFADYLDQTYCSENLSFYLAVTDYRQSVRLYFGATPDTLDTPVHLQGGGRTFSFRQSESAILNHEEQIRFDKLKAKFQDIIDRFILTNAPQEINIPYELRHQLLKTFREQEYYHPALLKPVCVAVTELMRISAFIPFATDPSRLVAATPSKSTTGIKMASSKNNGSNSSPVNGSLRRLRSASSLGLPQTGHAPPVPTATESDSPNTILRKLTNTLRIRARSQSPPRFYGWRHISIPDPSAFLTNTSNSATNTPAAPPMERGFSASSSNSTVSSASSPDSMSSSRYHSNNSATTTTTTDNNTATQDTLSAFHPFSDLVEASTRFFSSFGDTKGHSSSFHTSSS